MYIGNTDIRGLHHLVFEVVDNSIDEALVGFCKNVKVTLNQNGSVTVTDDGRGVPVEKHFQTGRFPLKVVMTKLYAEESLITRPIGFQEVLSEFSNAELRLEIDWLR